jgi:putative oxidoreductase
LLPFAILTEIGCAALIIAGLWTRVTALVLAAYTLLVALLFHLDLSVKLQQIMFLKNLAITGGLLLLAAKGAGRWSIDRKHGKT